MTGLKEKEKPTMQQLTNTERLTKKLAELPDDKKTIVTVMVNSFIFGMEAAQGQTREENGDM